MSEAWLGASANCPSREMDGSGPFLATVTRSLSGATHYSHGAHC